MNLKFKLSFQYIVPIGFTTIYALISLVNHYTFHTYALDLGLYTNALFKYSHFNPADSAMFKDHADVLLADHFDLYLPILSPFVFLFGSYTLLLVQIVFILIGALGIYKFFQLKPYENTSLTTFAPIYFLSFYGIFSAVAFDYHSNVVASMLVPWFFYFLKKEQAKRVVLVFVLILIAKENMALWMIFVCLGILFTEIGKDKNRKLLLYLIVFACLYFVVIVAYVMPALSYSKTYEGFKYHALGESPASALFHLLRQPLHALKLLFVKESGDTELNVIKLEFHVFVLLSGFIFLFKKPQYILMLVPVYMQKLLHDDSHMWGIDKQYSIEFAPILTLGVFSVLSGIKNYKRQIFFLVLALIGCVGVTIRSMDRTITYTKKSQIRFYQRSHYTCDLDLTEINEVLTLIPKNKPVSAISNVIPHLALRNSIYQFPLVKDAQFILVTLKGDFYPLNSEAFISEIKKYANCNEWQFLYRSKDILVLKRK